MTHRIGWEMEEQAGKTGRNQGLAAGTVWWRAQMSRASLSTQLFCMALVALLHLSQIATDKIWLTLLAYITHWVLQWASDCRAWVACLGFSCPETQAKLGVILIDYLLWWPQFPLADIPQVGKIWVGHGSKCMIIFAKSMSFMLTIVV